MQRPTEQGDGEDARQTVAGERWPSPTAPYLTATEVMTWIGLGEALDFPEYELRVCPLRPAPPTDDQRSRAARDEAVVALAECVLIEELRRGAISAIGRKVGAEGNPASIPSPIPLHFWANQHHVFGLRNETTVLGTAPWDERFARDREKWREVQIATKDVLALWPALPPPPAKRTARARERYRSRLVEIMQSSPDEVMTKEHVHSTLMDAELVNGVARDARDRIWTETATQHAPAWSARGRRPSKSPG